MVYHCLLLERFLLMFNVFYPSFQSHDSPFYLQFYHLDRHFTLNGLYPTIHLGSPPALEEGSWDQWKAPPLAAW